MIKPATILIVDDNAANRETICELLGAEGYQLREACDGPAALRQALDEPPDLVLLDVMMPGMDGFEVCRRLRADARIAEVPVIFVTALDDDASRRAGIEAGADDFVTKPFKGIELRTRLRAITRLNRYRRLMDAQVALRENEERYSKMILESPDAHFVHVNDHITFVNRAFCGLMGAANPAELLGLPVLNVYHPDYRAAAKERLKKILDGQPVPFVEIKFVRLDGTAFDAECAGMAFDIRGHKEVQAIVRDITERKQFDEHFLQAQKMEALGQFSGGIAHDFNNILAAIGGYTELARMMPGENPELRQYLESVLKASRRAGDLVRQILTFSSLQPQERRVIELKPIVADSIELLRASVPSTVEFDAFVDPDAPAVLANANQIQQVLINLGINAWHAMRERGGRLQIRLEKHRVDEQRAAMDPRLRAGVYARVSVSDTGSGMDPGTLRRIFEPFFTTKQLGEGTGLGLAVVHGIMDSHDGRVTVHSQLGEGTVFRLYFPAHAGELAVPPEEGGPAPRGEGERILVVDDEDVLATLHEKILTSLGYQVECATKPAEALAMVCADPRRFALVLTDQTMPGMTGLVLAGQLRQVCPELPIILMTGYNLSLTSERIKLAGIREVLVKPVTVRALGVALCAALQPGAQAAAVSRR